LASLSWAGSVAADKGERGQQMCQIERRRRQARNREQRHQQQRPAEPVRAKRFRMKPATRAGRPISSKWILVISNPDRTKKSSTPEWPKEKSPSRTLPDQYFGD
jgi:hypothetical protein